MYYIHIYTVYVDILHNIQIQRKCRFFFKSVQIRYFRFKFRFQDKKKMVNSHNISTTKELWSCGLCL